MGKNERGWLEDSVETPAERAELRAVGGRTRHEILVYDKETGEQLSQYSLRPSIRNYLTFSAASAGLGFLVGGAISAGILIMNNLMGNETDPKKLGLITLTATLATPIISLAGLAKKSYRMRFEQMLDYYGLHYPTEE